MSKGKAHRWDTQSRPAKMDQKHTPFPPINHMQHMVPFQQETLHLSFETDPLAILFYHFLTTTHLDYQASSRAPYQNRVSRTTGARFPLFPLSEPNLRQMFSSRRDFYFDLIVKVGIVSTNKFEYYRGRQWDENTKKGSRSGLRGSELCGPRARNFSMGK